MSEQIKDGGAAFPMPDCGHGVGIEDGMTLRDYFAAKAIAAIESHVVNWPFDANWMAERSYEIADAMIAERAKTTK